MSTPRRRKLPSFAWTTAHTAALLVLCVAKLIKSLDLTVVDVALPAIKSDVGVSESLAVAGGQLAVTELHVQHMHAVAVEHRIGSPAPAHRTTSIVVHVGVVNPSGCLVAPDPEDPDPTSRLRGGPTTYPP